MLLRPHICNCFFTMPTWSYVSIQAQICVAPRDWHGFFLLADCIASTARQRPKRICGRWQDHEQQTGGVRQQPARRMDELASQTGLQWSETRKDNLCSCTLS